MTNSITYIALKDNIQGAPTERDFEFKEMSIPELKQDQFLALNQYVSVDPGTRMRLSGKAGYAEPVKPGELITGFAIGRVVESLNPAFSEGDLVSMIGGWATHSTFGGAGFAFKLPETEFSLSTFLGVLGIPGMTSYFGLKRVGRFVVMISASG